MKWETENTLFSPSESNSESSYMESLRTAMGGGAIGHRTISGKQSGTRRLRLEVRYEVCAILRSRNVRGRSCTVLVMECDHGSWIKDDRPTVYVQPTLHKLLMTMSQTPAHRNQHFLLSNSVDCPSSSFLLLCKFRASSEASCAFINNRQPTMN